MRYQSLLLLVSALLISACGGGGGASQNNTSTSTPSASTSSCTLNARKQWVVDTLKEWYLYPETLPANIDINNYATIDELISALTATARAQRRDRNFTYLTSIVEENAYYNSGATAGFGVRIYSDAATARVFITEAFEGAPALNVGIDRRDELLAIGTTTENLRTVADIIAKEGTAGITTALGPSTAGTTRILRMVGPTGTRILTLSKADYSIEPVSSRYGGIILQDGLRRVGYINLRTFISSANDRLRQEFLKFKNSGINEVIIDLRYNGGGLVSTAELMGDFLGGNRSSGNIFSQLTFRSEKSSENSIKRFQLQPESITPTKLAFITTGSSASASELVINSFIPYFNDQLALIGANTYGKPVGQIAIDRAACDDRLRVLAFSTKNANNSDAYFNGLAETVKASCRAADDLTQPLGNSAELSIRQGLDYLAGKSCVAISINPTSSSADVSEISMLEKVPEPTLVPLTPHNPSVPQRDLPGLF